MSDLLQILLTSSSTIIVGILIFVLSWFFQEFIILPIQEYRKVITKIDNKLKFYANVISNPIKLNENVDERIKEKYFYCSKILRKLSCDLETSHKQIPEVIRIKYFKNYKNIVSASQKLIGLSNSLFNNITDIEGSFDSKMIKGNYEDMISIRELLGIQIFK